MTLPGTIRYIASPIARSSALQLCGFAGWALWFCHECRLSAAVDSCELSSRMMQLPKYVQLSESLDCVQEYTGYASISVVDTCGGARKNSPVYHSFHAICTDAFLDVTGEVSEESSVAKHRLSATDEWSHSSEMATASFRISWSELRVSDGKRTRRIQDMSPLTLSPYRDHVTDAGSGALRLGLHYFSGSPMKRGNNVVFPICASRSLTPHCGVSSSTIRSHHLLFYSTGTSNHQSY
jgi:hypothetical protein